MPLVKTKVDSFIGWDMSRKRIALCFLLYGASLLFTPLGFACTCGRDMSPSGKFDGATVVFAGTVTEVTEDTVTFQLEKKYKGQIISPFRMPAARKTTCDIFFAQGAKYLVYASETKISNKLVLTSTVCDGTVNYEKAREDLKYLEAHGEIPEMKMTPHRLEKKSAPNKRKRTRLSK